MTGVLSSAPPTRTFDCGAPSTGGTGAGKADNACGFVKNNCTVAPGTTVPPNVTTTGTQTFVNGTWLITAVNCAATPGTAGPPPVTPDLVREAVVRLLPPVELGVAPADGATLVNVQTIFWSATPLDRDIGPVTVLGQSVAVRIHFDHVTYDYGDGTTASADAPGRAWTPGACGTAQCPGFDGHTYLAASDTTASATVTWTATFRVAGGPTETIPGTVDGPTATHPVTVVEARTVLVR